MKKISFKAIFLGWLTVLVLFGILMLLMGVGTVYIKTTYDSPSSKDITSIYEVIILFLSFGAIVAGGFVAGKFASSAHMLHSFLSGLLFIIIIVLIMSVTIHPTAFPFPPYTIVIFLTVLLLLFLPGGYLAKIQQKKRDSFLSKKDQEKRINDFGKISEEN